MNKHILLLLLAIAGIAGLVLGMKYCTSKQSPSGETSFTSTNTEYKAVMSDIDKLNQSPYDGEKYAQIQSTIESKYQNQLINEEEKKALSINLSLIFANKWLESFNEFKNNCTTIAQLRKYQQDIQNVTALLEGVPQKKVLMAEREINMLLGSASINQEVNSYLNNYRLNVQRHVELKQRLQANIQNACTEIRQQANNNLSRLDRFVKMNLNEQVDRAMRNTFDEGQYSILIQLLTNCYDQKLIDEDFEQQKFDKLQEWKGL